MNNVEIEKVHAWHLCTPQLQPHSQGILSYVGENGPGLGWSHDTLNFGVFSMIIYVGKIDLQNSFEV